jgi:hypothetical protein
MKKPWTRPVFPCESSQNVFMPCNKTYVNSEQIGFFNNEIFIQMDDVVFRTSGIHSDADGIYFEDAKDDCGFLQKPCPRFGCPGCNFPWDKNCHLCGKKLK